MTSQTARDAERLNRLNTYLAQDPDNLLLRTEIFETTLSLGDFEGAQSQLDAVQGRGVWDAAWKHRQALLLMARGHYSRAEALLRSLMASGEASPVIPYNLAYLLFIQGQFAKAERLLQSLMTSAQQMPEIVAMWLRCQHRLHHLEVGLAAFRSAEKTGQVGADAYGVASLIAIDAGHFSEAEAWSTQALGFDPRQMEALVSQGTLALNAQDAEKAKHYLQRALAINESDGRTWSAMALADMLELKLNDAVVAFQKAVTLMPEHIGTWHGLGWCQLLLKEAAAAAYSFERSLQLDRNVGESHGGLAAALALQGRKLDAQDSIERALRLDPRNLSARYAQALLDGKTDAADVFLPLCRLALSQHKDFAPGALAVAVFKHMR